MSSLSDIKRRLASVKQTRQITGAMETVSVSKMRKTAGLVEKSREYMRLLELIIRDISGSESEESAAHNGVDIVAVLSSDKGLCGSFDQDMIKFANERIKDGDIVFPIGAAAVERYGSRKNVDMRFGGSYRADDATANDIAKCLLDLYSDGAKSVSVVYAELVGSTPVPTFKTLLPLGAANADENSVDDSAAKAIDFFEPSAGEIKKILVPLYMAGEMYGAIINHCACEHSARRAAMSAATKSADELIASLTAEYNRARQAAVTEQIVEIIGSTEALNDEKRV